MSESFDHRQWVGRMGGNRYPDKTTMLDPEVLADDEGTITRDEYRRRMWEDDDQ